MEDSEILKITRKVEQIARREKANITVEFRYFPNSVDVSVTSSNQLSTKGRYLLEKLLHVKTKAQRENYSPRRLLRRGSRTDEDGNNFTLWLFNVATCKIVGTRKEIREVKEVIESEKTVIVKKEVDVPIYECPKGTILE